MPISADTHMVLDMNSPKKDATVGEGAPTVGVNDVAIWANGISNDAFTTDVVGTFKQIARTMVDLAKKGSVGTLVASGPVGASKTQVAFATPNAGELGVYFGSDIVANGRTHFAERTLKRLLELWLEYAKDGAAAAPALLAASAPSATGRVVYSTPE